MPQQLPKPPQGRDRRDFGAGGAMPPSRVPTDGHGAELAGPPRHSLLCGGAASTRRGKFPAGI